MPGQYKGNGHLHQVRRDSIYQARVQDPYQTRAKLPEPTVCPDCGAIFTKGRWQWGKEADDSNKHRCPACRRVNDRVPAAYLSLAGDFFDIHKDEIMHLIHNKEEKELAERPLERIMSIEDEKINRQTVISYTGVHLAKSTGDALRHAYQGEFEFEYTDKDGVLYARWWR